MRSLIAASLVATAAALLPAAPASACIDLYVPVVGSFCDPDPCPWLASQTGVGCP
ncbi:MAG TPA: hypothetical protein VGX28_06655 [Frankiaceae bacterium]|jgi:hypothetical protein|nr:hypothetical protein [Frankiaceae bacterium]